MSDAKIVKRPPSTRTFGLPTPHMVRTALKCLKITSYAPMAFQSIVQLSPEKGGIWIQKPRDIFYFRIDSWKSENSKKMLE